MPIRSHLTYKEPAWLRWWMLGGMVLAVLAFVFMPTPADILGALVSLQTFDSLRLHTEKKFWKRQAESLMGGEVARALHAANRDLLRVVK